MQPIFDYMNALTGASDKPIRLAHGETHAEVADRESLQAVVAAADEAGEPLYMHCVTGDETAPLPLRG